MLKKRYLFLILIVCLFAISAVSAAEISNETNMVANDDSSLIVESVNEDTLSVSLSEEKIQGSADNGTFTALQKKIDDASEGSIINLENNYTYDSEFSNETITINKTLTINGNGYVIDALNQSRIFSINSQTISLNNITFKNSNVNIGAIYLYSSFANISNCNFIGNTAKYRGGAIYLYSSFANISNCNFIDNVAESLGGAISFYHLSSGNVTNCNFTGNLASDGSGGAISFYLSSSGNVTNCNFIDNTATNYGGAIYSHSSSSGNVTNCNFIKNKAITYDGGALYLGSSKSNVTNCNFISNAAKRGNGAAIRFHSSYTKIISNSIFINNTGNSIIYSGFSKEVCIVQDSILINNKYDKAIIYSESLEIKSINNWFGNNATNYNITPIIYGNVEINNWLFINGTDNQNNVKFFLMSYDNKTKEISKYDNALFPKVNLTLSSVNTTLNINHAELNEEINYFNPLKNSSIIAQVEDVKQTIKMKGDFDLLQELINNASNEVINLERDYIYNEIDTITMGVLIKKSITINGNGFTIDASSQSRIFNIVSNHVNLINITFRNGKNEYGSAIRWYGDKGNIIYCNFINNSAIFEGGAINAHDINISHSLFINNTNEKREGGAIYIENVPGKYANIFNCTFINNTANEGGAIYGRNCIISGCNFKNNFANGGGAVDLAGYCEINNSYFSDNHASNGGSINLYAYCPISNSVFINNSAINGGSLYSFESTSPVSNCSFINNSAEKMGGAIYITSGKYYEMDIVSSTFINNSAESGGALSLYPEFINIHNSSFSNNMATKNGGAIIFTNSKSIINIINVTCENNKGYNGGAIQIKGKNCTIVNSSFVNNFVYENGGSIYIAGENTLIFNSNFTRNTAKNGGALTISSPNSHIDKSLFNYNYASSMAGAIHVLGVNAILNNSKLLNNFALYGSAIQWFSENGLVNNSVFINNKGTDTGTIHVISDNITISNSILINNTDPYNLYSTVYTTAANNNWFGNNEINYNQHPSVSSDVIMDSWLFLNATANPTIISINNNSRITFKLDSFNSTSKQVSLYDASKMNVQLNLSQTLGELNQNTAFIGENIVYTAKQSGYANVTGKFETASYTINLRNTGDKKENLTIGASAEPITVGEDANVIVTGLKDAMGNVTVTVNGKTYTGPIKNSEATVIISGLTKSVTADVNYLGDIKYNPASIILSLRRI